MTSNEKLPRELPRETGEGGAAAAFSPHSCRGRIVPANFLDRFRAALLAILLTAAFAVPALAGPFEDAVAKFANDDFSDTDEAIGTVAVSGNPLAFPIISALQDGRLSADPEYQEGFRHRAPTARSSMPPPAPPSTSCRMARLPSASTTACAAPWRRRSAA